MSEWPRSLPPGWAWARFADLCAVKSGITKGKKRKPTDDLLETPYLRVANVQRGHLDLDEVRTIQVTAAEIEDLALKPGDLLLTEGGDRDKLGRGWIWSGEVPGCIHQNHVFRARPLADGLTPKFLSWYTNTEGKEHFLRQGKQTTNLASINKTQLSNLPVAIAPAAEQRRIVAKTESLLERSRRAKEALGAIPPLLDKLRQSILAAAFRGDLTADWRAQNPDVEPAVEALHEWNPRGGRLDAANLTANESADLLKDCPESWGRCRLGEAANFFYGFAYKRTEFTPKGVRLLRGANIGIGQTKWDDVVFAPAALCEAKYALKPKDIVIAMDRPFISGGFRVALLSEADCPASLVQRVARLRPSAAVTVHYLYSFLLSASFEQHLKARVTGSSVPHVSGIDLGSAWMPLPPVSEQTAIAAKVAAALKRVDVLADLLREQTSRANKLDSAVLAKAFRGELVEQDPNDEPASVLLERIRAAREVAAPAKKKPRKRRVGGKKTAEI